MITIITVWLCLITHVACDVFITVNNNGDNSSSCCVNGTCPCSSLSSALHNVSDNTVINITSESVTLHDIVGMGSGNLSHITITGNGATIMCNNTGGVYCESCSNITIMGITWYQCGRNDPTNPTTLTPTLNFTAVSNMIIQKCVFKSSSGCPIYIKNGRKIITLESIDFTTNSFNIASQYARNCAGVYIDSERHNLYISIVFNRFYSNGCRMSHASNRCHHYDVIILLHHQELVNVVIESTEFSNNSHGLYLDSGYAKCVIVQLSHVNVSDNSVHGIFIGTPTGNDPTSIFIDISYVILMNNMNALSIVTPSHATKLNVTINISNSYIYGNVASDADIYYSHATKLGVLRIAVRSNTTSVTIANSYFYNNFNGAVGIHVNPYTTECDSTSASITFTNVTIYNTTTTDDVSYASIASVSIVTINVRAVTTGFSNVRFISNHYSRYSGEVLLVENNVVCDMDFSHVYTNLTNCSFDHNTAYGRVVFLHIKTNTDGGMFTYYQIILSKCNFDNNFGSESIVYILGPTSSEGFTPKAVVDNSTFSNNKGTVLYSIISSFHFDQFVSFTNNTANSGAAIYFEEVHHISSENSDVRFINNCAIQRGGALYFNLVSAYCNVFSIPFNATFINNSANIAGNSIYFSIPQGCHVITDPNDKSSLLYVPNKFSYFQPAYIKSPPTVTSPYRIKLHSPAIWIHNSSNDYSIQEPKMLGEPIQINASVLDYFNNITEPVTFFINCETCGDDYVLSTYQITVHYQSLHEFKVFPSSLASGDVMTYTNISVTLLAILSPVYKSISATLLIELSPCRTGYLFGKTQQQCVCYLYPDIVHCTEQYVEIKIGYWVGPLTEHYTSSICPSNYCNFAKRTESSPGYYDLPRKPDDQCSSHRTGVACGECKSGYTLAYDSPDCINTDKCSAGMTILVIVLTILYWIAIVVGVFGLMYFQFQISSGYAYGIIYFYSIVDVLLVNDVSEGIFHLVGVLSSFAKLNPQLFGQLCLVEGLSGIDQQFIHYSHALAVSLILIIIILVKKYSPRLTVLFGRCVIRVICILLLLSYTCLASTSLQLLRPLIFKDVNEVHTYSSPDIKYFTGRHLVYAIVAILCEVIVVIGLPLFLLLEPFLRRRFNLVRIKPLIDQFQGCYKDKYRWFAAYYLICRQVIILIVYVGNGNYYYMLYGLQTTCVIIAMIHGWVQPYKNNLLNGLDEVILLTLVLIVNLNLFSLSSFIPTNYLSVVLVILPLLLICFIAIRKLFSHFSNRKKSTLHLYYPVEACEENNNHNDQRR